MFRWGIAAFAFGISLVCFSGSAQAQIGEPGGSFEIVIRQGGNVIATDTVTVGAGGELSDLKSTGQDGDPESFTQIGTIGGSASPIILKLTTDGDPSFRLAHFYIDVPASLCDIYSAGPTSLFDPLGGGIDVTISNFAFDNAAWAMPFIVDNNSFAVSFMRDVEGHFYELPNSRPYDAYGFGVNDIQVPGEIYRDAIVTPYAFDVLQMGQSNSWVWKDINPPTLATTVHNGLAGGVTPLDPGYVFELGLSMAFVPIVPEPGTLLLVAGGWVVMMCRTRVRRLRRDVMED